jgi:hypothetical protein
MFSLPLPGTLALMQDILKEEMGEQREYAFLSGKLSKVRTQ